MKNLTKRIISFSVLAVMTVGIVAAANWRETITVDYGVGITVDGGKFVPTDANGNIVNPFIYNGTTYVPLRGVSQALGADVSYNQASNTAIIEGASDAKEIKAAVECLGLYTKYIKACDSASFLCDMLESIIIYSGHIDKALLQDDLDSYWEMTETYRKELNVYFALVEAFEQKSTYFKTQLADATLCDQKLSKALIMLEATHGMLERYVANPTEEALLNIVMQRTEIQKESYDAFWLAVNNYNRIQDVIVPAT